MSEIHYVEKVQQGCQVGSFSWRQTEGRLIKNYLCQKYLSQRNLKSHLHEVIFSGMTLLRELLAQPWSDPASVTTEMTLIKSVTT